MDSFIERVKSSLSEPPYKEGGRAASDVDSNPVMPVTLGSLRSRDVGVGDVIQVDTDIGTHPLKKRARTDRSEGHMAVLSTLEYDKRVADSLFCCYDAMWWATLHLCTASVSFVYW